MLAHVAAVALRTHMEAARPNQEGAAARNHLCMAADGPPCGREQRGLSQNKEMRLALRPLKVESRKVRGEMKGRVVQRSSG
jgi:hypothetical protein